MKALLYVGVLLCIVMLTGNTPSVPEAPQPIATAIPWEMLEQVLAKPMMVKEGVDVSCAKFCINNADTDIPVLYWENRPLLPLLRIAALLEFDVRTVHNDVSYSSNGYMPPANEFIYYIDGLSRQDGKRKQTAVCFVLEGEEQSLRLHCQHSGSGAHSGLICSKVYEDSELYFAIECIENMFDVMLELDETTGNLRMGGSVE